jgi:hypothetical protein
MNIKHKLNTLKKFMYFFTYDNSLENIIKMVTNTKITSKGSSEMSNRIPYLPVDVGFEYYTANDFIVFLDKYGLFEPQFVKEYNLTNWTNFFTSTLTSKDHNST